METTIVLTMEEQKRVEVIQRVFRGELTMGEAAMVLGITERHSYRIKARIRKGGVKGIIHGNRGRSSDRKLSTKIHRRIVELTRGKYRGFNNHHLTEKLSEQEGIEVSREKVRQILRSEGISSPRKRRPPKHRSRRERREAEGMMLQVDGSPHHDWLEGRGPYLSLIGAIDDACRLQADLYPVGAEITLCCGFAIGVDVERIIGTSLHAGLAVDAALIVEINDAVGTAEQSYGRADSNAGGVVAVVAYRNAKVTFGVGKLAFLDVFNPRPIDADRNIVLFFTGYRAGVTADAAVLVNDKTVAHQFFGVLC